MFTKTRIKWGTVTTDEFERTIALSVFKNGAQTLIENELRRKRETEKVEKFR